MKRSIPVWITIIASLIALSGLAFSVNLYFSPQTFFPGADFLSGDARHFTDMWAMRQFVFAVFLVYALVTQKVDMLRAALLLLILLNFITIADGLVHGDKKVIIESLVYTTVAAVMVIVLQRRAGQIYYKRNDRGNS